jgi:hypothetical protein
VATRGAPTMPFREEPVGGRHEGGRESESLQPHGAPSGGGGGERHRQAYGHQGASTKSFGEKSVREMVTKDRFAATRGTSTQSFLDESVTGMVHRDQFEATSGAPTNPLGEESVGDNSVSHTVQGCSKTILQPGGWVFVE